MHMRPTAMPSLRPRSWTWDVIQINLGNGSSGSFSGYVLRAQSIEASVIAEDPLHID